MTPGERFLMNKQDERFAVTGPEKEITPAGKQPVHYNLHFQNASLANVFKTLEARFGKKIIYKPEGISDKLFTGDLGNQADIETAIKLICISNNLQYEVKGDSIIIH